MVEDENEISMAHIRMGYSAVSAYFEPGDDMIVNAFYVNKALGEIMGNVAHIIACNATVGSPIDGQHFPITSLRIIINQANITVSISLGNTPING